MEVNLIQGSPEWLEFRMTKISASQIPIIMRESKWRTPLELWKEKMGLTPPQEQTESMARGLALEPYIRELAETKLGVKLVPKVMIADHPYDFIIASLDGISYDSSVLVELKTASKKDHLCAKKGTPPQHYYGQTQCQMFVTQTAMLQYGSFYIDAKGKEDFHMIEVKRDEVYIKAMIEAARKFYNSMFNLCLKG